MSKIFQHLLRANRLRLVPLFLLLVALLCASSAIAQQPGIRRMPSRRGTTAPARPSAPAETAEDQLPKEPLVFDGTNNPALKFDNAPADILLQTYAEVTGLTLLLAPNLPKATITLRSQSTFSKEEYLRAIETVLVMNNIALVPDGDKFLRVFPANELRKHGVKTLFEEPANGHDENGRMVSQMIALKHITLEEAKKVIEGFKRGEGQIQLIERTNSILITDTAENVNRMAEILHFVDQPLVNREETHVRPIKFAKAADIKKRLEEVIAESLKEQEKQKSTSQAKSSGSPGFVRRHVPGVIRPGAGRPEPVDNAILETNIADAERGVIRGKVQIVADERTNMLIFITRPENMTFFDRIIDVLDVEVLTTPDVIVEVMRLEYSEAKTVAELLNNLIGNAAAKDDSQDAKNTVADRDEKGHAKSSNLADAAKRATTSASSSSSSDKKSRLGELNKDNVKILADERSNAIVVMATPGDVETIRGIIGSMDIQLSQVVIETVIVSVSFGDSNETGMDWVQHALTVGTGKNATPRMAFATAGGGGTLGPLNPVKDDVPPHSKGLNAWFSFFDINMDLVLMALESDSRSRLMSSPRITTMDNKEATLEATDRIYWKEGTTRYDDSDYTSDNIKNEDIGIKLTVTPRINKKGYITLTVKQEIQTSEGTTPINGSAYPNLNSRTMGADVAVQSGETVVLGGLAQNKIAKTVTGIPILRSIPLLGRLFRYDKDEHMRTEIIVFLTPRVIDTPAQMEDDARNVKASMKTDGVWDSSWSISRLADPLPPKAKEMVRSNASNTVAPARYPLTGYLTGHENQEKEPPAQTNGIPYIHYSDVSKDSLDRIKGFYFEETTTTNAPAPAAETEVPVEKKQ